MRMWMIIMLFLIPAVFGYGISPCKQPDNGVFRVQYPTLPGDIYIKLYSGRGLNSISYDEFRDSKGFIDGSVFTLGDEFCLLKDIDEEYKVKEGDTYWSVWERYGSVRGIPFQNFVEINYGTIVDGTLDVFAKNVDCNPLSKCGVTNLPLDHIYSYDKRDEIREANQKIIGTLDQHLDREGYVFDLTGKYSLDNIDTILKRSPKFTSQSFKVVILPSELFLSGSLSLGGITRYAFNLTHPSHRNGDVTAVILDGHVISMTYPETTHIDDLDRRIFDKTINKGTDYLKQGNLEKAIYEMQKMIVDGANLADSGVELLGQELYMNGNPIVTEYDVSPQDMRLQNNLFRDFVFYLHPKCGDNYMDRLEFARKIEEQIEDAGGTAEIVKLSDFSDQCLEDSLVAGRMSVSDESGILISINSSSSSEQKIRFSSIYGGMFAYIIQSSVREGDKSYFEDLVKVNRNYALLANPKQLAIELQYNDDDLSLGWWDKVTSIFSGDDPLVGAMKNYAEWEMKTEEERLDFEFQPGSINELIAADVTDEDVAEMIKAIILKESKGIPMSISPPGCKGLLHLCSAVSKDYPSESPLCDKDLGCFRGDYSYDDRYDMVKSVKAAAEFFTAMSSKYSDTRMLIAAYYAGEPLIDELIKESGSEEWIVASQKLTPELIEEAYCSGNCDTGYFSDYETRQGLIEKIKKDTDEVFSMVAPSQSASLQ